MHIDIIFRYVLPNDKELTHILSLAQVMASCEQTSALRLITFDGDNTLYPDGVCAGYAILCYLCTRVVCIVTMRDMIM